MSISGYELSNVAQQFAKTIADAINNSAALQRANNDRILYTPLLIPGNLVEVQLNDRGETRVVGELTRLTDTGLCLAYYDEKVAPEALLRLIPYTSILLVIELPPVNDDE